MRTAKEDANLFKHNLLKKEAPRSLGLTAALVAVMGLGDVISSPANTTVHIIDALIVVSLLTCALIARRPKIQPRNVPWIIAAAGGLTVAALQLEVILAPAPTGMAFVLLAMTLYAPFVLEYAPAAIAGTGMLFGSVFTAATLQDGNWAGWSLAACAALAGGLILLTVRLQGVKALEKATEQARDMATHDPLTGVLNRRGVYEKTDAVRELAQATESTMFALYVDIDGLKHLNDTQGHEAGDQAIEQVAAAIGQACSRSDIVGRWGGDEFIIIGLGDTESAQHITRRMTEYLDRNPNKPENWAGTVSTGVAVSGQHSEIDALLDKADQDMYTQRRRSRRSSR